MTVPADQDHLDELSAMLESAGTGLSLLELPDTAALTAPEVSGVSVFLALSGTIYILRTGARPARVEAGQLALVPANAHVRLSVRRSAVRTIDSRERLVRRGRWIVVPTARDEHLRARVAAARIIGSRAAALSDILVFDVKACAIAGALFRGLADEVDRGAEGHAGLAMALMNACVIHAIRREHAAGSSPDAAPERLSRGALAQAITTIRGDPGGNHTIDTLAQRAGMSRSSFLRAFARATGSTPQRYLQQMRLHEAAALLLSTTLPVKAVAAATGFASRSHFSRAFREAHACDPSTYRRDKAGESVPLEVEAVPETFNLIDRP